MATHDYPASLMPRHMEWGCSKSGVQFQSPFNGAPQAVEFPAERWQVSITLPDRFKRDGGEPEAFFGRLAGGVERVRLWHFLRPQPVGTMRGSPVLNSSAARGDLLLKINTSGTLKAGDLFKVGDQLFQAFQDCAPVSGVLTVPLVQRVRTALAGGAAVQWDKPTILCVIPAKASRASYSPSGMSGIAHELEEVYA